MRLGKTLSIAVVGMLLTGGVAWASPILNMMVMSDAPGDVPVNWTPVGNDNGDGSFTYSGSRVDDDGHWTLDWTCTAKQDPYISASYTLVNTDANTLTYTLITSLPIVPVITPASLMGGSTGGALTDANFNGVATAGTGGGQPLFAGLIDGATALSIYPHPSAWSVAFAGQTLNIPDANVGLPGPTIAGPAVMTDIGIRNQFTLTPGDRVTLNAFFVVTPEPSSCVLLVLGAFAALRRVR